jgi:cGMP-dependent protein kinase 2
VVPVTPLQVAEAKVIKRRVPQGGWQVGCLAPKVKMLQVGQ